MIQGLFDVERVEKMLCSMSRDCKTPIRLSV